MSGKKFFNPLNGTLTEMEGRSTKKFSLQGIIDFRRAILADTPPPPQLKGASFAPDSNDDDNNDDDDSENNENKQQYL
jgi:hypothetical protein